MCIWGRSLLPRGAPCCHGFQDKGRSSYGTTWDEMGIDPELDYEDKVKSLLEGNIDVE